MPANPLYTLFMADLRRYDQVTLMLFGIVLLAVLIGWVMAGNKTPGWQKWLYFGFLVLADLLISAGCAYLIITGGYQ